jgi:hypothetical protein
VEQFFEKGKNTQAQRRTHARAHFQRTEREKARFTRAMPRSSSSSSSSPDARKIRRRRRKSVLHVSSSLMFLAFLTTLLTGTFSSSSFSSASIFFVRAEGELKVKDEGQLIASRHFPIHGYVPLDGLVPPLASSADVKITLTISGGSGQQKVRTTPKKDGTFALLDVPPGDHKLQIVAIGFSFPPIVVSVDGENDGEVVMRYSEDMSTILPKVKMPEKTTKKNEENAKMVDRVVVAPVSKVDYFEPSNRVTLLGLLKNPMVLMVLMTVVMAVAVPSLIRNMDPEALEELKKEMGKGNVFQQMAAANKAMDASVEKQVNSKFGNSGGAKK